MKKSFIILFLLVQTFVFGQNWKRLTYSPTPRYFHSSAIEPTSKQIFLFGGKDSTTSFLKDDEWIYDTSFEKWTQCNNSIKPSPRWGHSLSFISKNKFLLYGGQLQDSTFSDETWIFDLTSKNWQLLNPSNNPSGRAWHSIVSIGNDKVLLFGGKADKSNSDETWIFDLKLNSWELISTKNKPSGLAGHSLCLIDTSKVLLFGGATSANNFSNESWIFDINQSTWNAVTTSNNPTGRTGHSICKIEDNKLFLFGGFDGKNTLNDIWKLNLENFEWEQITLDNLIMPAEIQGHSLHYVGNNQIILLGDDYNHFFFQYWNYNFVSQNWVQKNPYVKPIGNWSMCQIRQNQMLLFGCDIGNSHSETWLYNISNEKWNQIYQKIKPETRTNHKICNLNTNKVLLYGGIVARKEEPLTDTWILDLNTLKWEKLDIKYFPFVNYGFSLINNKDNQVLLYGGKYSKGSISDLTWIYDYTQNTWSISSNPFASKPTGRFAHAMCKIDDNNAIMYGGKVKAGDAEFDNNEIWNFNITDKVWTRLNPYQVFGEISGHLMEKLNDSLIIIINPTYNKIISNIYNFSKNKLYNINPQNSPYLMNNPSITLTENGQLLLMNGTTSLYNDKDFHILNLEDSSWYNISTFRKPRQRIILGLSPLSEDRALMIGSNGSSNDTWLFSSKNEGEWEEIKSVNNPPLTEYVMMSEISNNQVFYLAGKNDVDYYEGPFKECWIFNSQDNSWKKINTNNFPANRNTSIAYLSDDKILLFGGYQSYFIGGKYPTMNYTLFDDTWIYDLSENSWINISPLVHPPKLLYFSTCKISENKVILFGGMTDPSGTKKLINETWLFDLDQVNWTKLELAVKPQGRIYHSMCNFGEGKVILYGGLNTFGEFGLEDDYFDDTWLFELNKMKWTKIEPLEKPNKRVKQKMCYLKNNKALLFGGSGNYYENNLINFIDPFSDPWIFDLENFTSVNDESKTETSDIIYPNPSESEIYLKGIENGVEFSVFNQFGSVLMNGIYEGNINIEKLNTGVYFIKIIKTNSIYKFIKL